MKKMKDMTKMNYETPIMEVTHVETEGTIAESGTYSVTLHDWIEDNTSAPYDGDIWLNL